MPIRISRSNPSTAGPRKSFRRFCSSWRKCAPAIGFLEERSGDFHGRRREEGREKAGAREGRRAVQVRRADPGSGDVASGGPAASPESSRNDRPRRRRSPAFRQGSARLRARGRASSGRKRIGRVPPKGEDRRERPGNRSGRPEGRWDGRAGSRGHPEEGSSPEAQAVVALQIDRRIIMKMEDISRAAIEFGNEAGERLQTLLGRVPDPQEFMTFYAMACATICGNALSEIVTAAGKESG